MQSMLLIVFFFIGVMLQYDVILTIIAVGIASFNLAILGIFARKRANASAVFLSEQSQLVSVTVNGVNRIETIKSMGNDNGYFSRWANHQAKMVNARQKLMILGMSTTVLEPFLKSTNNVIVLGFGAYRVMNGYLSMGMLVALQSLLQSFIQPFGELMKIGGKFQEAKGSIDRLNDVLSHEQDSSLTKIFSGNVHPPDKKLVGNVKMENVTFGYSHSAKPLIENFGFAAKPGQRIAVIGYSGSGKSTVIKLLSGLHQPWSGAIILDGVLRENISRSILNNSVAFVDQNIFLFEGTIRENLTLWNANISEKQMIEAAKNACVHEDIMSRKQGYDSFVEEGGRNFSGGQRQRLEIARALVIRPSILLLDEATNSLDSITEKKIDNNLRRLGCTCIIVAHRLSTIRDCDEIIVMDQGKIVQRGSHRQMISQSGAYKKLVEASLL